MTPLKSIRLRCLDCCGYQAKEVRLCSCTDCALWPFRFGRNPNVQMTDARRLALEKARLSKKNPVCTASLAVEQTVDGKDTTHPITAQNGLSAGAEKGDGGL